MKTRQNSARQNINTDYKKVKLLMSSGVVEPLERQSAKSHTGLTFP